MREYETVIIIQPNLSETEQSSLNERVSSLIEKHSGKLFFARDMGKKNLAYRVKKQTKGIYTCFDYAADNTTVSDLERTLMFDENILRFLTVVRSDQVDVEARAAEVIARGEDLSESQRQEESAAEKAAESAAEKTAEKTVEKTAEKTVEKTAEKTVEKTAESTDDASKSEADESTDKEKKEE